MDAIAQLIDKYGVSLGILVWMFYRDWRFLTKLESALDRFVGGVKAGPSV